MQCQKALIHMMKIKNMTTSELTKSTQHTKRWMESVTRKPEWKPKLDTIWSICDALGINVISFFEYAEKGSCTPRPQTINPPLEQEHVSRALKEIRRRNGFSQHMLAKVTSFQLSAINLREGSRYRSYPTVTTLSIYCKACGIPISDFVGLICSYSENKDPIV
ncbi:helix-turn-helix transcriptional regulator [uncultured Sphaerochaeta sp.]|uniref:helix-turn-helix transcriptional regulator n=1 Tax=uncultured Sphaerochaeta sp. TaxID=886478 RepID=UPI002A0A448C|nr:helix-turn-helix transcriptional regulator [uncultured Sphaerochaeta sp.]